MSQIVYLSTFLQRMDCDVYVRNSLHIKMSGQVLQIHVTISSSTGISRQVSTYISSFYVRTFVENIPFSLYQLRYLKTGSYFR